MVAITDVVTAPPQPPQVTNRAIWAQFSTDIRGKEVQTAETYSHSWVANQFGHVCLGIILASALTLVLGSGVSTVFSWLRLPFSWHVPSPWDNIWGCVLVSIGVSAWEWRAYSTEVREATGHHFPVGRRLLRDNAVVAAAYMILGVAIAFIYRFFALTPRDWLGMPGFAWTTICFAGIVIIGILLAVPWLRQKIVWQKAGLPYLFRLADTEATDDAAAARHLQAVIDHESGPPPNGDPIQIVVGGPISSGRTQFCAAIGTEFAFRKASVRYLSFAALLEFAAQSGNPGFFDDPGPENIRYWPWSTAQVVIIDDIGPLLTASTRSTDDHLEQFRLVLATQLGPIRSVLARCHTVWVIGDARRDGQVSADALDQFAREIKQFCDAKKNALVVELERPDTLERTLKLPRVRGTRSL
ncbi:MAG TPA: hypothetical protein VH497_08025 [Vicinamibacterales bacterium]